MGKTKPRGKTNVRRAVSAIAEQLEGRQLLSLLNGGFEAADFSGWGTPQPQYYPDDAATVVASYQVSSGPTYAPVDGAKFALLPAANGGRPTVVTQDFRAEAGDTISGWAFFDNGNPADQDSFGYVAIKAGAETVATPFTASAASTGDFGQTPWTQWTYTFTQAGSYRIEAGAKDVAEIQDPSYLGLDAVEFSGTRDPGQPQIKNLNMQGVDEGERAELSGLFEDETPGDTHQIVIDWGDGTQSAPLSVDPFPGSSTQFSLYAEHVYRDQPPKGLYYFITVTLTDASGLSSTATTSILNRNQNPVVTEDGPSNGVPGQTLHYVGTMSDPAPDDVLTPLWQVTDESGAVVATGSAETFDVTPTAPGSYTVWFSATDDDFGTSNQFGVPLTVETAQLQPSADDPQKTVLAIGGTTGNDFIMIRPVRVGRVQVIVNGASAGMFSPTAGILVYGQAGNDRLAVLSVAAAPVTFYGGEGNDALISRSPRDLLIGGPGDDVVIGRARLLQ